MFVEEGQGGNSLIKSMEATEVLMNKYHKHITKEHQSSSYVIKHIKAPVDIVWSLVRRFDEPQKYKPFIRDCIVNGDLKKGCVRQINVQSGLPATTSTELLEKLDDDQHILCIRILGGDHRLKNYSSVVTVHPEIVQGKQGTMVIESFVVDIPKGNTADETNFFVRNVINWNHDSLAYVSERMSGCSRKD